MVITAEAVKALRSETGVSVMECKKALEEASGDVEKARTILATRAGIAVGKKANRELGAGTVASYIHTTGEVGALVLLSCETDFVSKNEEFRSLARELAMQVAAMRPESVDVLMAQSFIKDSSKTIGDLLSAAVQKFGERVEVTGIEYLSLR